MFNTYANSVQDSFSVALSTFLAQVIIFIPRVLASILLVIIGVAIAKWIRTITSRALKALNLSKGLKDTPVEAFLKDAEIGKIEEVLASIVYWLFLLLVIHSTAALLGLQTVSVMIGKVFGYIPNVLSAVLILFFGVLLAGIVESLVKGTIRSVSGQSARLLGKVSSYLIMIISTMAAIAELHIAQQFISTLFTGFVITLALAFGLAFGLGGKSVVEKMMQEWYSKTKKELEN